MAKRDLVVLSLRKHIREGLKIAKPIMKAIDATGLAKLIEVEHTYSGSNNMGKRMEAVTMLLFGTEYEHIASTIDQYTSVKLSAVAAATRIYERDYSGTSSRSGETFSDHIEFKTELRSKGAECPKDRCTNTFVFEYHGIIHCMQMQN